MEVSEISDYFVATLLIFFCHVCKHTAETVDECQRISLLEFFSLLVMWVVLRIEGA